MTIMMIIGIIDAQLITVVGSNIFVLLNLISTTTVTATAVVIAATAADADQ